MQISLSLSKILKTEFEKLILSEDWFELLLEGAFYEFEKLLHQQVYELYDKISEVLIDYICKSSEFIKIQKEKA